MTSLKSVLGSLCLIACCLCVCVPGHAQVRSSGGYAPPGYQWVWGPGGYQLLHTGYPQYPQQQNQIIPPVVEWNQLPIGSFPTGQEQPYPHGKWVLFTTSYGQRSWVWYPAVPMVYPAPQYQVPPPQYQYPPYAPGAAPPTGAPNGPRGVLYPPQGTIGNTETIDEKARPKALVDGMPPQKIERR